MVMRDWIRVLGALAGVVGLGIGVLSYVIFEPVLSGQAAVADAERKAEFPRYDYHSWHSLPVLYEGRIKPFESAAAEIVSEVTGRSRFEGNDPVAVVLQWRMLKGTNDGTPFVDWEKYPFILCDHRELRSLIYRDQLTDGEKLTATQTGGKYVSPEDLRRSESFKKVLDQAQVVQERDPDKVTQNLSPVERKAREVAGRLVLFDSVSQNSPPIWGVQQRMQHHPDPLLLVALDRVPGAGWFSPGELRDFERKPADWTKAMEERLDRTPQLYINPERRKTLEEFQAQIKAGTAQKALDELAEILRARSDARIKQFEQARRSGDSATQLNVLQAIAKDEKTLRERIVPLIHKQTENKSSVDEAVVAELRKIATHDNERIIEELHRRIPPPGAKYHPDDPRFRMLHLDYLENRYPDLYPDSAAWQKFPAPQAHRVLAGYDSLRDAYKSQDAARFDQASGDFFATLVDVSKEVGPYPGEDTIGTRMAGLLSGTRPGSPNVELLDLERDFNRVQPFRWAWVSMLAAVLLFGLSLGFPSSRAWYRTGYVAYLSSLVLQAFGFFCRIIIAGRPPVSDMYETVIWVAFMSSIFALILEAVYRRRVIILAGSMAATLALVLADQLPLVLNSKITSLEPVLRSNYWLTIHVLTIVSSYAGGTVAWALANLALGIIAFQRRPRRELVKTLSHYTYRAMQIAIILLAAGTFLGGWWAAESWGRFWGWDPKEVWALIALVCYVIPLHMRFAGWLTDFGLAVSAVLCYAIIVMSWYGVNFVLAAGLHSYGFGGGGPWWVFWAGLLNVEWVLAASIVYLRKIQAPAPSPVLEEVAV